MYNSIDEILDKLETGRLSPEEVYEHIYGDIPQALKLPDGQKGDIAVIGYSCRLPGAESGESFWKLLSEGRSSISNIPSERWDIDEILKQKGVKPGQNICRKGGFIDEIDLFDAAFFEVSDIEAKAMDPQQRILMESVMDAVEHSGYDRKSLWGTKTGVFIGARAGSYKTQDYGTNGGNEAVRASLTGAIGNFNSARISDFFNLKGPSLVFDTACSSSLVSTHYACKSILNGECDMAVAGGIHLNIHPDTFVSLNLLARSLSPDGKCYTFDKRANGFVPGEGVGVIILKPLTKALEDGDTVYAVIKGSAVNNDGKTIGVTTPDFESQKKIICDAFEDAGIDGESISYLEAHGTGTMIGDPIEIRAAAKAFGESTKNKAFCAIGSVKTNIGHLDTAAGIASLIKVILALQYKKIPPTLNLDTPNPRLSFVDSPFYTVDTMTDWKPLNGKRRAGISSFGFGGTNCHIIMEEGTKTKVTAPHEDRASHLFFLSARTGEELKKYTDKFTDYLKNRTHLKPGDLCFTSGVSRAGYEKRLAVLCSSTEELQRKLEKKEVWLNNKTSDQAQRVVFMFAGQGAQYPCMAKELYRTQPVFREEMDRCDSILKRYLNKSLIDIIYNSSMDEMKETDITQPVTFAISYSLAKMWMSFGIKPSVLMGHSVGEYTAACIGGVFSLEDGLKLISARGRLMQEKCTRGAMAALMCSEETVNRYMDALDGRREKVSIGAYNGPASIVVSGEEECVTRVMKMAEADNIRCVRLAVSHGFHSPLMMPCLEEYGKVLDQVTIHENSIPIMSNVTGSICENKIFDREYWLNHIMKPVRFSESIKECEAQGCSIFLEVGPAATLCNMAKASIESPEILAASTLNRSKPEWQSIQETLAQIYIRGINIDYKSYDNGFTRERIALPSYPFSKKSYWIDQNYDKGFVENNVIVDTKKDSGVNHGKPTPKGMGLIQKYSEPQMKIKQLLFEIVKAYSTEPQKVSISEGTFFTMGLDSSSLVEISARIEAELNIDFFPSAFFEHQTIEALADFITREYGDKARFNNGLDACDEETAITGREVENSTLNVYETKDTCELDEIAVIGISGNFPKAKDLETFWRNLENGLDCVDEISDFRWNVEDIYDSDKTADNKTYLKRSGLLESIDKFDPAFFNISPKEAREMDPQQRLFLQGVYHCVENAGYAGSKLYGSNTGVFVGVAHTQYREGMEKIGTFTALGNHEAIIANRVSYFMNFNGPCLVINTQCSSSLVAIHTAIRSIQNGDCEYAVAGGVTAVFNPIYYICGSKLQAFSPDGRCKAFDSAANGYVPGEGYGILLLKPLKKALRDRDIIHAVIKGSAINHGGRSNNLSAPNANAQSKVIQDAMKNAKVNPESISYIEAHGTGTSLGDPVELRGLTSAFNKHSSKKSYCAIGSLKSNIGHLESAAGVAGIIKVILAMKNRKLPPILHFNKLNPYIDMMNSPFYVNDRLEDWTCDGPKRAGVSSFGMGGSNAHVILEEPPKKEALENRNIRKYQVFTLSAKSRSALERLIGQYAGFMNSANSISMQDIIYTGNTGRGHFEHRLAVGAVSMQKIAEIIRNISDNGLASGEGNLYSYQQAPTGIKIGYVFTGKVDEQAFIEHFNSLFTYEALFKEAVLEVEGAFAKHGFEILSYCTDREKFMEHYAKDNRLKNASIFMFQFALAKLFIHAGLTPKSISASGAGVFAAALVAGISDMDSIINMLDDCNNLEILSKELKNRYLGDFDVSLYLGQVEAQTKQRKKWVAPLLQHFPTGDKNLFTYTLEALYTLGADINWENVYEGYSCQKIELPLYPFEEESYWVRAEFKVQGSMADNHTENDKTNENVLAKQLASQDSWKDLLYRIAWSRKELGDIGTPDKTKAVWINFCGSDDGLTSALNKEFENKGIRLLQVRYDNSIEDFLKRALADGEEIRGFIYTVGYGKKDTEIQNTQDMERMLEENVYQLLSLIQSAGKLIPQKLLDFVIVTQNAVFIEGKSKAVKPFGAMLWGMAKVAALEYKNLRLKCIDFDYDKSLALKTAQLLIKEACFGTETYIVYKEAQRYVSNIERIKVNNENSSSRLKEQGVYILTGGLGGIGLETGKYLAHNFKAKIVLLSRSHMPSADTWDSILKDETQTMLANKIRAIREMKECGAEVLVLKCDVTRKEDVRNAFEKTRKRFGKINGIFHLAGILKDKLLCTETKQDILDVMAPKVVGALLIDEAAQNDDLDLFVLYSSVASIAGNIGQGNYAAANSFLDAFAFKRILEDKPAVVMNWTLWEETGMGVNFVKGHQTKGLKTLKNADAMEAMAFSINQGNGQVIIADLSNAVDKPETQNIDENPSAQIKSAKEDAEDFVIDRLLDFLCRNLDYKRENVGLQTSFMELGIDSILGVNLIKYMEDLLGVSLSPTLVYDYPNIISLSEYMADKYNSELMRILADSASNDSDNLLKNDIKNEEVEALTRPTDVEIQSIPAKTPSSFEEDDIAIIGMSCRFPGAKSLLEYYKVLSEGRNCIKDFPEDKPLIDVLDESDRKFKGGYIDNVYDFDPQFFNITPKEAELMDPQQRVMLKVVWEAMENAGYAQKIYSSDTGVFIGASTIEYQSIARVHEAQVGTGNALSIIANRISYFYDLRGPSMTFDTACSSSIVALDNACANIRQGNCEMAIAGGVSLILLLNATKVLTAASMLSPDAQCKTFDSQANGYVRGEGCGAVLLKPVGKALRDGDNIYAVIKGSAVNQDGHTNGLTAPNALAQEAVIKKAWKKAKIDPENITCIEAHGTGTSLGDPIEIKGITEAFGGFTDRKGFCAIGSVKTNLGHLEPAAGIASLIKVALEIKNKVLFPTLNFNSLNPMIDMNASPFYISDRLRLWESERSLRTACISSFGFGGTNSHVVLQEMPESTAAIAKNRMQLFTVSARTKNALNKLINNLAEYIENAEDLALGDISHTLNSGRKHFQHRIAFMAKTKDELVNCLKKAADNNTDDMYSIIKINERKSAVREVEEALKSSIYAFNNSPCSENSWQQLLEEVKEAYLLGVDVDWEQLLQNNKGRIVYLPTYAFEEEKYLTIGNIGNSIAVPQGENIESPAVVSESVTKAVMNDIPDFPLSVLESTIAQIFVDQLTDKLKFKPEDIDLDASFMDFGFDSIFAVNTIKIYEEKAGITLEPTLLYDFGTIREMSEYLAKEYGQQFQTFMKNSTCEKQVLSEIKAEPVVKIHKQDVSFNEVNNEKVLPYGNPQKICDIAVIGMSARLPGAEGMEELWDKMSRGWDGITVLPAERMEYGEEIAKELTKDAYGGYLKSVDMFDPLFFNISGKEAESMDPQQRLMLESVWEAIEDAGYGGQLSDARVGMFIGVSNKDYSLLVNASRELNPYMGTGNSLSVVANRISYILDLKGPSMAIDTACSSSLVAIHLACQSIYSGESSVAIAGGVNLNLSYETQIIFKKAGMLSPENRCKTFDDSANGYVRGECVGALLLKPLEDAIKDGDNIYAVIKSSAVNQDGHSNGLTVPNAVSQTDLICESWDKAQINPETVTYIEAHGTGTSLGDPIEFRGLTQAFRRYTDKKGFCGIGSVKSNIGHSEPASGIAGVIKVIMALKNKMIPPTINFNKPSSKIGFLDSPFYVNTDLKAWETVDGAPRRAGISSYGFGGTNAHVVIEEAPAAHLVEKDKSNEGTEMFLLSAKSRKSMEVFAGKMIKCIDTEDHLNLSDMCYTLSTGREHFNNRMCIKVKDKSELKEKLELFLDNTGKESGILIKDSKRTPKIVFMYSGQGSQYHGAGLKLYQNQHIFREAMNSCEELLYPYINVKLTELLYSDKYNSAMLEQTRLAQPVLFSMGYALTCLWKSWGIRPDLVLGHSVGEYAAAAAAGIMSLEDSIRLISERGRLMGEITAKGAMYAVFAPEETLLPYIKDYPDAISIAAVNGPQNTVLSGAEEQLSEVIRKLSANKINAQKLAVSNAFHSPLMKPALNEFLSVAKGVKYAVPSIPIVSNVSAEIVKDKPLDAQYWAEHIIKPVRFMESIKLMEKQGYSLYLEVSGRQILVNMARKVLEKPEDNILLSSLDPARDDMDMITDALGRLYVQGAGINWNGFYENRECSRISLPTYSFEKKSYWFKNLQKKLEASEPAIIPKAVQKDSTIIHIQEKKGLRAKRIM